MDILFISELIANPGPQGRHVMVIGYLNNYNPIEGTAILTTNDENCRLHLTLDLTSCQVDDIANNILCRIIGRSYKKEDDSLKIEVESFISCRNWNYAEYKETIELQRKMYKENKQND
ncbi:uncharacterized protein LOC100175235 [Ciona intestinalis]